MFELDKEVLMAQKNCNFYKFKDVLLEKKPKEGSRRAKRDSGRAKENFRTSWKTLDRREKKRNFWKSKEK